MTATLLNILKINSPIFSACLSALQKEADALGLKILIVGATARELLFADYDISGRATADVDIAVMVGDWDAYADFLKRLIDSGLFAPEPKINHRLRFQELPVDIIPFGGVEKADGNIIWPENTGTMNMTGFQDVYKHALSADIGQGEKINVASLPGMAVLKIVAWNDRRNEYPTKDAEDLALILYHYAEAGNMDRLYEDHPDFVADVGGDLEPAGARLLGHDMAVVMSNTTKQAVQSILSCNTIPDSSDRLVEAIFRHIPGQNYERALDLLQNIKKGLGND